MDRKIIIALCAAIAAMGLSAGVAHATNFEWTGTAGDWNWTTGTNWKGNSSPPSADWKPEAKFDTVVTVSGVPVAVTPGTVSLNGNKLGYSIAFNSGGWTITGGQYSFRGYIGNTAGDNRIDNVQTYSAYDNQSFNVSTGSTLTIGSLQQVGYDPRTMTFNGGGTLHLENRINNTGNAAKTFNLNAGTLRIDGIAVYNGGTSQTYMNDTSVVIQLQTSVAAAQALIGTEIFDGVGDGLHAYDIGGGYTEISFVPEPASIAMLSISGLLIAGRRRKA